MKTKLAVLIGVVCVAGNLAAAGFGIPALPGVPETSTPAATVSTPPPAASATGVVEYTDANPPPKTLEQTMADAKNSVNSAKDAQALKKEVDKLLRDAASNVHVSSMVQTRVLDGLGKYLGSMEKMTKLELNEELKYSELEFRFNKAVDQNAPISDIKTVITTDLQGSKVSGDKIIEQLNAYKAKRDVIDAQADGYYNLFLKSGVSLTIVDKNYQNALVTGDVATKAVGDKLNQLQAKSVTETAATAALIGALVYYANDLQKKNHSNTESHNPFARAGRMLGDEFKARGAAAGVQALTKDLQKTKADFEDMKVYAEQARGLLDEIHSQGPVLRDQNQKISTVLGELSGVAKQSLEARAKTDQGVSQLMKTHEDEAQQLAAADKIPVFAQ